MLQEATQAGQSIFQYAPEHNAASQYRALVDEVQSRLEEMLGQASETEVRGHG